MIRGFFFLDKPAHFFIIIKMDKTVLNKIARSEGVSVEYLQESIRSGETVVPLNIKRRKIKKPTAIGKGLRTKVNANIGSSPDQVDVGYELEKLKVALEAGTDTVMDLSTGGDLYNIRKAILKECSVPLGTVPIYQACVDVVKFKHKSIVEMSVDELFNAIEKHCEDGVDFITVHCGVTLESVERLREQGRLTDVVSRGGTFLIEWMVYNKKENPLYEYYDRLLDIAKEYEVTLSLGDGLRPGSLADATDRPQIQELIVIGELVDRARERGVQAMVEGPGHIPLNEVATNVMLEKKLCRNAPFYVLGPLVTDVAPGYDHITAAIGGASAAAYGTDFLCYVTPSEHLSLPTVEDVREGVVAMRIAAHAGDIAKGIANSDRWDHKMSNFRKHLKWDKMIKTAIDPKKAKEIRDRNPSKSKDVCTMCGEYCAIKHIGDIFKKPRR